MEYLPQQRPEPVFPVQSLSDSGITASKTLVIDIRGVRAESGVLPSSEPWGELGGDWKDEKGLLLSSDADGGGEEAGRRSGELSGVWKPPQGGGGGGSWLERDYFYLETFSESRKNAEKWLALPISCRYLLEYLS